MNGWELIVSFIAGLIVNEMTDISPWVARKLVRWAAYRWSADPEVAAGYAEEWAAIIDERPGKLLKLITAVQFSVGALVRAAPRRAVAARHGINHWLANSALGVGLKFVFGGTPTQRVLTATAALGSVTGLFEVARTLLHIDMPWTRKAVVLAVVVIAYIATGMIFVKSTTAAGRFELAKRQ